MTTQEAMDILGLAAGASEEEVESAFRRAAKAAHPDAENGDRSRWDRLIEARDLLLAAKNGQALVPLDALQEVIRAYETSLIRLEARADRAGSGKAAAQAVITRHTAPINRQKRIAWAIGAFAGGIAALLTILHAADLRAGTEREVVWAGIMVALYGVGAVLSLAGLVFRFQAERLEHVIEDVTAQLSQRSEYLRVLNEIRRETEVPLPWSRDAFDYALDEWEAVVGDFSSSLAATVKKIGIADFGEIFLAKGLEMGVLEESTEEMDGEFFAVYDLAKEIQRV